MKRKLCCRWENRTTREEEGFLVLSQCVRPGGGTFEVPRLGLVLGPEVIDCSTNGTFLNGLRLPPRTTGKAPFSDGWLSLAETRYFVACSCRPAETKLHADFRTCFLQRCSSRTETSSCYKTRPMTRSQPLRKLGPH